LGLSSTIRPRSRPTGNPIPTGSTVTFQFFTNGDCSGDPSSEETVALNGGSLSESVESSGTGPLAAGSYSYKAKFNSGDTSKVPDAESECEPFTVLKADPTVTTAIHLMPGHVVVTNVTMGATIHDDATVTGIAPFTPSGTVTFNLYRSNDCTGDVVQTSTGTLSGSGASATAESSDYLTTAADIPALSFQAQLQRRRQLQPRRRRLRAADGAVLHHRLLLRGYRRARRS
jgi:hypothetical protein